MALRVFTAEFGMGSGVLPLAVATKPSKRMPGVSRRLTPTPTASSEADGARGGAAAARISCGVGVIVFTGRKPSLATSRQSFASRMTKGRPRTSRFLPLCATGSASPRLREQRKEPIERLGPVSCTHCCASTPGLSTWWSTTALRRDLVLREASRLDAFSGYPVRT